MAKPKLTLYLDIVSPFGYMAYWMTRHSPMFKPVEITYVPILLGGVFKLCNNQAPLMIKNKDKWINVERNRWSSLFKIPICEDAPPGFPPSTVQVQRALCAVEIHNPSKMSDCLDALYEAFWVQSQGTIGKAETFGPVLEKVLGKDGVAEMLKQIAQPDVKKRLGDNTDQAFKSGAFGIPWWECTNEKGEQECFWGVDHMGQVVEFLGLDRSKDAERTGGPSGMRSML